MKINPFKDKNFFRKLEENVSPIIISIMNKNFHFGDSSSTPDDKIYLIEYFNPNNLSENVLPQPYENDLEFRQNKKFFRIKRNPS